MAIYRNISIKFLLAKIMRDLKPQNDGWILDAVEWAAEALAFIGALPQYIEQSALLQVESHRVLLPSNLVVLNQIAYLGQDMSVEQKGVGEAMRYNGSSMFRGLHGDNCPSLSTKVGKTYALQPPYLQTEFESGIIRISYKAVPVDENCWPLVPDSPEYAEALLWYIMGRMMLGGWTHPNPQINYQTVDAQWKRYAYQARAQANFPDMGQMEALAKRWVSLVSENDRYSDFFEEQSVAKSEAENLVTSTAGYFGPQQTGGNNFNLS